MSKSIEKRAIESTIAGILTFGLSIIQSILLVPVLLKYWGEEKYALWIALWAFVSLLRLFDQGLLSLVGNEFTMAFHNNKVKAANILGSAIRISFLTGIVELIFYLALLALGFADDVTGIPDSDENGILFLGIFIALFPWALGGSMVSVVLRTIPALGLYSKMLYISIIMKVLEILILITGALGEFSIFAVTIFMSISLIFYTFFLNFYLKKIMPEYFPWWNSGTWKEGVVLFKRSLSLTTNNILEQYTNNGIIVLISKTIGIAMLPVFTTTRTLTNTAIQITHIIIDPLTADLLRYKVNNDYQKIIQVFLVNWFILGIVINIPLTLVLFFINDFYEIWTAGKLIFNPLLFLFLSLSVSIINFGRPIFYFIRGLNMAKALNTISIIRFTITFGIALPLIQSQGLWILGFSLFISEFFCSIVIPIYFLNRITSLMSMVTYVNALLPAILLSMCYALWVHYNGLAPSLIILFTFGQIIISVIQWRKIDNEVKSKILNVMLSIIRK